MLRTGFEPATPSLGGTCSNPAELPEHDSDKIPTFKNPFYLQIL